MKKTYFTAAVTMLMVSAAPALAADLPSRKGPPPYMSPPLLTWTGFYVGINAGYTWSGSNAVNTIAAPFFIAAGPGPLLLATGAVVSATTGLAVNTDGFVGGGQIGYNWQFSSNFVAGVEADIQGVAGNGNSSAAFASGPVIPGIDYLAATSVTKRLDYFGTLRGRIGFLITPTLLVYGTGGLAYGGVSATADIFQIRSPQTPVLPPMAAVASYSDTRVGWTVGGGGEWMFWPNWSAKVEYLYYDLGTVSATAAMAQASPAAPEPIAFANGIRSSTSFNGHLVRAGLNYHFNWGAAPIAASF